VFFSYLLYMFGLSGGVYPYLKSADLQFLGKISDGVNALGYIANRWWLIFVLFLVFLCVTIILTFLLTRTSFNKLRAYNEYLKTDMNNLGKLDKIQIITLDIGIIALFAVFVFVIIELITMAITTIILSFFISSLITNYDSQSFGLVYLIFLVVHVIVFPLLVFLYKFQSKRKLKVTSETNINEFLKGDGEVDMEKWKAKTWGKKPYSYNWESDEYVPITCFSCGSIISSNFSECPICNADLLKEIEEINAEYSAEDFEDDSERVEDKNNQKKITEVNDEMQEKNDLKSSE
ncbi:MAG: ABC transporter ATP-binding protein, partial [Candidatus Heimdallarchaeota archaeon]|nr:ABC transporter ATP-binding protein [Candidatus Heimdallarchaeota archaeon]